jgi:hypothetical protein
VQLFSKKSKKILGQHNCFTTIDELPVKVWFDIHKTGDSTKLLKKILVLKDNILIELNDVWAKIYDEFITRFGLSDEFMADLRTEINIANLQAEYIITGQKHLITLIKVEQEKKRLNDLDFKEPTELESILAKMSKYYGFKLSSRDLTVVEYYSYLNNIGNGKN